MVTGIVAVVDDHRQTLTFANAGHPPPLLCTNDRQVFLDYAPADLPLGLFRNHPVTNYVLTLPRDALVVFYTDGITEHGRDPIAGATELLAAARRVQGRPELSAARAIAREVLKSGRGNDDAAVIGLRSTPERRGAFSPMMAAPPALPGSRLPHGPGAGDVMALTTEVPAQAVR
jgi:serine phosphatase RsbU (regulator of sigma subunit)